MKQFAAHLSCEDLHRFTEESVARFEALVVDLVDADVVFVPDDPDAQDVAAADPADQQLAWTLGHVTPIPPHQQKNMPLSRQSWREGCRFMGGHVMKCPGKR